MLVAVQEGCPNHEHERERHEHEHEHEHEQLDPAPFDHDRDVHDDPSCNQRTSDVDRTGDVAHHHRDRMCGRAL